jgi:hypothetical protein
MRGELPTATIVTASPTIASGSACREFLRASLEHQYRPVTVLGLSRETFGI